MQRLASREDAALDPYKTMALTDKRVIHPGGGTSTKAPFLGSVPVGHKPAESS